MVKSKHGRTRDKQNLLQFPAQQPQSIRFHAVLSGELSDDFPGQLVTSTERLRRALEALCDICSSLVADAPREDADKALKWLDAALDDCYRIKQMLDECQRF